MRIWGEREIIFMKYIIKNMNYYSGKKSKKFWRRIGKLETFHDELYHLGIILQNLESFVLSKLREVERKEKFIKE